MTRENAVCVEFEMTIADVFIFEDGRTVFAGEVTHGPKFIPPCECILLIRNKPAARFRIEGEMLPMNATQKHLRSVSTIEQVDLGAIHAAGGPTGFQLTGLREQHEDGSYPSRQVPRTNAVSHIRSLPHIP